MIRMATSVTTLLVVVVHFLTLAALVTAMPSFEGVTSWSAIGNLVPGMSVLEGLGPASTQGQKDHVPFYMSIAATRGEHYAYKLQHNTSLLTSIQGNPGNVTMYRNRSPPLFYIHQNQLWHYHNESAIMPVNVLNSTGTEGLPLQLAVGAKPDGVPGGRWRWQGTRLFYENGAQTDEGLFYSCADVNGLNGLFLFLQW